MAELMEFRDNFIATLTDSLQAILPDIKEKELFPSEGFLLTLAKILDLVLSLDTMKNMKGSVNNDLSIYKRFFQIFNILTSFNLFLIP